MDTVGETPNQANSNLGGEFELFEVPKMSGLLMHQLLITISLCCFSIPIVYWLVNMQQKIMQGTYVCHSRF